MASERTSITPFGKVVSLDTNKDSMSPFGDVLSIQDLAPAGGWTGTINGVTNPSSVNGFAVAGITNINGVT